MEAQDEIHTKPLLWRRIELGFSIPLRFEDPTGAESIRIQTLIRLSSKIIIGSPIPGLGSTWTISPVSSKGRKPHLISHFFQTREIKVRHTGWYVKCLLITLPSHSTLNTPLFTLPSSKHSTQDFPQECECSLRKSERTLRILRVCSKNVEGGFWHPQDFTHTYKQFKKCREPTELKHRVLHATIIYKSLYNSSEDRAFHPSLIWPGFHLVINSWV